jgi:hypothetical protein
MNNRFGIVLLAAATLFTGCAPAARPAARQNPDALAEAAKPRFPIKVGEVWQMTAFKPGNKELQKFPIDLYGGPEIDDGLLRADAESGRVDAHLVFFPEDDTLGIYLLTSGGENPDLVLCQFDKATGGKTSYSGEAYFGKLSDLQGDRPSQDKFGNCLLEKTK